MAWGDGILRWATGRRGIRLLLGVLLVVVGLKVALEIYAYGWRVSCWDTMLISGATVFAIAVTLALSLPARLDRALTELRVHGALPVTEAATGTIKVDLEQSGARMVRRAAVVVFLLVLSGFVYVLFPQLNALWQDPGQPRGPVIAIVAFFSLLTLICALCGFVGGALLGRVATYGRFARLMSRPESALAVLPGHYDGANGLKPIGDLYLYQAFLTMFPVVWLAVWWLIIPHYDRGFCGDAAANPYLAWRWPLVVLWIVSVIFLYLAFVRPILQLRSKIASVKASLEGERVPLIRAEIEATRVKLTAGQIDEPARSEAERRLAELAREHWDIVHMSVWPMDRLAMRQYFSVNAAGTVAPLLLKGYGLMYAEGWLPGVAHWLAAGPS